MSNWYARIRSLAGTPFTTRSNHRSVPGSTVALPGVPTLGIAAQALTGPTESSLFSQQSGSSASVRVSPSSSRALSQGPVVPGRAPPALSSVLPGT